MSEYRPGDKVVLPPYGVGVVARIAQRTVGGVGRSYYQVEFLGSRSRAFVPVDAPTEAGLRPALSEDQVPVILNNLRDGRMVLPKQWAARHRRVTEILTEGDLYKIAILAGQLRSWEVERGLPDLDRQAFRRAVNLLVDEIAQALDLEIEKVREILANLWSDSQLEDRSA